MVIGLGNYAFMVNEILALNFFTPVKRNEPRQKSPNKMSIIDQLINRCQKVLYPGFPSQNNSSPATAKLSGLNWLDKVCGELSNLCRHLHKLLIFEIGNDPNAIETCFLCTSQIVVCIKYLEKALTIERRASIVLTPTRQFFLDRIVWCLSRIKTISVPSINAETNFVHFMDVALDMITPLCLFAPQVDLSCNIATQHEVFIESNQILALRSIIDELIGQTLAFINVAPTEDRKPLTAMCQKVLKDCIAYQGSCSMEMDNPDDQNRRLKAATLEKALYQLDKWMNDSLLKLVFEVFVELKLDPLQQLRDLCEHQNGLESESINAQIEKIDEMFEKIIQIGNFALSFAWDYKLKSKLRSSLASLESLDSFLIPSIISKTKVHSEILQNHWNDEISTLTISIQTIIDTHAFCDSLIDILNNSLNILLQSYNKDIVINALSHCDILEQHFRINSNELELEIESSRKLHFDDYVLMLKECKAAMTLCEEHESGRVVKRLKILLSVLKKFHVTVKADSGRKQENADVLIFGEVSVPSDKLLTKMNLAKTESMKVLKGEIESVTAETFFKNEGIVASPMKSVLYESKREKTIDRRSLLKMNDVSGLDKSECIWNTSTSPIRSKRVKKRSSLRVALFKRSKENETKQILDAYNNDTLGLHITDILDQITDVSNTLSNMSNQ